MVYFLFVYINRLEARKVMFIKKLCLKLVIFISIQALMLLNGMGIGYGDALFSDFQDCLSPALQIDQNSLQQGFPTKGSLMNTTLEELKKMSEEAKPSSWAREVVEKGFLRRRGKLLSLGAGNGLDEYHFFNYGGMQIILTERNPELLYLCNKFDDFAFRVYKQDFIRTFVEEGTGTFDVVYARLILHYFGDSQQKIILNNAWKYLRPGGKVILEMKSKNDWLFSLPDKIYLGDGLYNMLTAERKAQGIDYIRNFLHQDELTRLLEEHLFKVLFMEERTEDLFNSGFEDTTIVCVAEKLDKSQSNLILTSL